MPVPAPLTWPLLLGSALGSVPHRDPAPELLVPVRCEAASPGPAGFGVRFGLLDDLRLPADVRIPLTRGVSVTATLERVEDAWGGGRVWHGRVTEGGAGPVILSTMEERLAGTVRLVDRTFELRYAGRGLHSVFELDVAGLGDCEQAHLPPFVLDPTAESTRGHTWGATPSAALEPPTVDVLIVYTDRAMAGEGGQAAIEALINLSIAETNAAYADSQVLQRVRLVAAHLVSGYSEHGDFTTELNRLRLPNDGHMDAVHSMRKQYGADLVGLIVESLQLCGRGYQLVPPLPRGFADYAFSVTSRHCAAGNLSLAHELGHNMGCHHQPGAGQAAFAFSYGHRTSDGRWRTVMAVPVSSSDSSQRVRYFSSPALTHQGQTLGVAQVADNVRSLKRTQDFTTDFVCAVPTPIGGGKVTSLGATAQLAALGSPSQTSGVGMTLSASNGVPGEPAIFFWGGREASKPWLGGRLFVGGPKKRLGVVTFDNAGSATMPLALNAFAPGNVLYLQVWFADPTHPDGSGVGMTNGVRIEICP